VVALGEKAIRLGALTADTTSKLDILGHDGNTLGMDSAQVGVLKETNEVSLSSFLKSSDGRTLEAQVGLEVLGNLSNETLEGQLTDQQLSGLLELTDLTESDGSGAEAVRLLDATTRWGLLTGLLGSVGLTGSLTSGRLTSGLLSTSHFEMIMKVNGTKAVFVARRGWNPPTRLIGLNFSGNFRPIRCVGRFVRLHPTQFRATKRPKGCRYLH
jgi:hypothetical protein